MTQFHPKLVLGSLPLGWLNAQTVNCSKYVRTTALGWKGRTNLSTFLVKQFLHLEGFLHDAIGSFWHDYEIKEQICKYKAFSPGRIIGI